MTSRRLPLAPNMPSGQERHVEIGGPITRCPGGYPVAIKSWVCPGCQRTFIVDWESSRDVCPWCNAAVEEHDGTLRIAPEEKPPTAAPATDAGPGAQQPAALAWWPFRISS